jgi:selenocysteine lyase/cysteine desulfurase
MSLIEDINDNESLRNELFPVTAEMVYMSHAGVTALPKAAGDAMRDFIYAGERDNQESSIQLDLVEDTRAVAAELIGSQANEIALLGPTSVGLSLVANGLEWAAGDEVVSYFDDYPANVYPWMALESQGVKYVNVETEYPGVITWDLLEKVLTPKTRLVSLASCHFLSGFRIDIDTIGKRLHEREIFFCVDGIQTIGAFPTSVEHVDFLSADSHKWMLGPAAAGIFYVRKSLQKDLNPILRGAYNVVTPEFVAQDQQRFYVGGRRFEPGMQNLPGIIGMRGSLKLILDVGIDAISNRLLELRQHIVESLRPHGYSLYVEEIENDPVLAPCRSAIISVTHPEKDLSALHEKLKEQKIAVSNRQNREGTKIIRLSPHFYNTEQEIDRVAEAMR